MATISPKTTRRGKTVYQVRVRLTGRPPLCQTFDRRTDAKEWAAKMETEFRRRRAFGGRRTVEEAIGHYLQHGIASLAISDVRNRKRQLEWWRERIGRLLLENVGPGDVREALRELSGRKVATLNRYRAALSAVLSFAVDEEWIDDNPLHRARRRNRPNAEREVERDREVTADEWNRLREACRKSEDPRLLALVVCAYASGAREGELMGMEWKRAELNPPGSGVPRVEVLDTKNGTSRMLYFPGEAGDLLRERRKTAALSRYVFALPGDPPDKMPVFPTQAWKYWRRKAGVEDLRFHDLRHSWACRLLDSGANLAQLMILGGWKTANMVRRYAARAQRHGSDAVDAMHARMVQAFT
jgi:integrase